MHYYHIHIPWKGYLWRFIKSKQNQKKRHRLLNVDGHLKHQNEDDMPVWENLNMSLSYKYGVFEVKRVWFAQCSMTEPQSEYSAEREASYGHGIFEIENRTHAYFSWHRNEDGYSVEADSMWFLNRFWHPLDDSTTHFSAYNPWISCYVDINTQWN